jgi:hypothetical protein
MNRRERRTDKRVITAKLNRLKNSKEYKNLTKYFNDLPKEDYQLLSLGIHSDTGMQIEFGSYINQMRVIIELETSLEILGVKKNDTTLVEQH